MDLRNNEKGWKDFSKHRTLCFILEPLHHHSDGLDRGNPDLGVALRVEG